MNKVYLGIGTNQGDRGKNLAEALKALEEKAGHIELVSSVYETEPWGFRSDNLFLNMAVMIETELSPSGLLKAVHLIEAELGRTRSSTRYVSRVMDIDILFYNDMVVSLPDLVIPHPLLHERRFVLVPLADIAPGLKHPVLKKDISELLSDCRDRAGVKKSE